MVALALALIAAVMQDPAAGPPLPPEVEAQAAPPVTSVAKETEVVKPPSEEKIHPIAETPVAPQKLVDRPEAGPSLGGFLGGSLVVVALLVGLFVLLKRFGRGSRFLAGG